MKKTGIHISSTLGLLLFLIICGLSACDNQTGAEDNTTIEETTKEVWTFPRSIKVKAPNAANTRVSYDDRGTEGVKQTWDWGDKFVLYNSDGDSVLYTVETIEADASYATFDLDGYNDLSGTVFYAVFRNGNIKATFSNGYPTYSLNMTGQTQSYGSSMAHLENYDLIATGEITDIERDLVFVSQGTLLTFSITDLASSFGSPTSLTIEAVDASNDIFQSNYSSSANISTYTLNLSGYDDTTTALTAYIMLPPFTLPAGSGLSVLLESASNELRHVGQFTNAKSFEGGVRYNFPVKSFTKFDTYTQEMDNINIYFDSGWGTTYKPTTGDGSEDNPYLIDTAWNLAWLKGAIHYYSNTYNHPYIYFKLTTNIYIEDGVDWKQIGIPSSFKASFDGGGNEVTNLSIKGQNSHEGFFGETDGASISNLTISGNITASGSGGSYFGGLIGSATNTTVKNCNNYVEMVNPSGSSSAGIIGRGMGSIIIENCNNYAKITSYYAVGGIIGQYNNYSADAKITNCNNYGDIIASHQQAGGILGYDTSTQVPVSYCLNTGSVTGGQSQGDTGFGGIVGYGSASTITYCTNQGAITGKDYVGTIIGQSNGGTLSSTNSNTGTANGNSNQSVGSN